MKRVQEVHSRLEGSLTLEHGSTGEGFDRGNGTAARIAIDQFEASDAPGGSTVIDELAAIYYDAGKMAGRCLDDTSIRRDASPPASPNAQREVA